MNEDINTPEGMLRYLLRKNEYGVWFVKIDGSGKYIQLPRWIWEHCVKACKNPLTIDDDK